MASIRETIEEEEMNLKNFKTNSRPFTSKGNKILFRDEQWGSELNHPIDARFGAACLNEGYQIALNEILDPQHSPNPTQETNDKTR